MKTSKSVPLLTAREAARHLQMPESTLDSWISPKNGQVSLVHAVEPERRGWPRMPFVAIIEAYVLRSLREMGLSMQDIRIAVEYVRSEFGDEFALANRRISTDGVGLFVELADRSVVHVRDDQLGIREVLQQYLQFISWNNEGQPTALRLKQYPAAAEVVIDPRFGWGAPVLASSKAPVEAILDLWRSGEPMTVVAHEFDLSSEVVEDVLRTAAA